MNPNGQTVLERLHKTSISAKDIANQFWCEKQLELSFVTEYKPTQAMNQGTSIHSTMQKEVYVPLSVEPATYADRMYKTAYENLTTLNTLMEKGVAREFRVYGSINGYRLSGQIDEFQLKDGKVVIVENKTTNQNNKFGSEYMKPHIVQVMLYRHMMDSVRSRDYTYENFSNTYRLKAMALSEQFKQGLSSISVRDELISLESIYRKMFDALCLLPEISDELHVHYVDRQTGNGMRDVVIQYNRQEIDEKLKDAMGFWRGEREARPVPEAEKWKCNICRFFGKECKVWWTG